MTVNHFYDCITDFIFVEDGPEKADVIFVPGGHVADHALSAARLYHKGFAPYILPSGRYSKMLGHYSGPGEDHIQTEWEYLREILMHEKVPEEAILKEDQATYTWENAICSRRVLEEKKIRIRTAILCPQAYHARRALMYYQEQFPDTRILVVPTVTRDIRRDNWYLDREKTDAVLGELVRIGEQFHCVLPLGNPRGYAGPGI